MNDNIEIIQKNGYTKIDISKDMDMLEFYDAVNETIDIDRIANTIVINNYPNINRQTISYFEMDGSLYNIAISRTKIIITEKKKIGNHFEETDVLINAENLTYRITKITMSLDNKVCSTRIYDSADLMNRPGLENFQLNKSEALLSAKELLDRLFDYPHLKAVFISRTAPFLSYFDLYKHLNLVEHGFYHPIIEDEVIALSSYLFGHEKYRNPRQYKMLHLEIILKETLEKVGKISFNYVGRCMYEGNVSYEIYRQYQNNGYGKKALALLKELVKDNEEVDDNTLYVATKVDNYASQKVALANGGVLSYNGEVPETESLNYIDGVKRVKIYKIELS